MDNRIEQILGNAKFKQSINVDNYINVQFDNEEKLLPFTEINKVINIAEQFDLERQSSKSYRILGTIKPVISNVLFNATGNKSSLEIFSKNPFISSSFNIETKNLTFKESIETHLKENDGWYGYYNLYNTNVSLCTFYDMEPKRERFTFIPDITNIPMVEVKNWDMTITYPFSSDTQHYMIKDGLILIDKRTVLVGGKTMTAFATPVPHNLNVNNTVRITGTSNDGVYIVKRLGLDNGSLKSHFFCLDIEPSTIQIGVSTRMSKLYNDTPSLYYFRLFKKIKTKLSPIIEPDDYEIYDLYFSKTVYSDGTTQFIFNEDIDITNLKDNLGRPLSQLYLTIIKTTSNNIFTSVTSGIETPYLPYLANGNVLTYLKDIPIIQKIHNVPTSTVQSHKPLERNVKINDLFYYGDVVEYNTTTLNEITLSEVHHRFNTTNRETTSNTIVGGPRPEGYYYKAHNLIQIRHFSTYLEQGDDNTVDMPDYKVKLSDGKYIWRDLLKIGTTDNGENLLNYPFLNGSHYMYNNYIFKLKRQDPFGDWGIYYSIFPQDPVGNSFTNNYIVNSADNVC